MGAMMSVGYCTIAVVMSWIKAADPESKVVFSREDESRADYIFGVFNALGGIAFTFGGQAVLPEIQVGGWVAGWLGTRIFDLFVVDY